VRALLLAAKENQAVHIPDRIKTSGMITLISGEEKTQFILKPDCQEIITIEAAFKKLLE
jgi:hypothetical protein